MSTTNTVEAWMAGPIEGVPPMLMPAAHALTQARNELHDVVTDLTPEQIWQRPGGVAAIGYHLQHLAGATNRLLAYAHGRALTAEELAAIKLEGVPGEPAAGAAELLGPIDAAIDSVLATIRNADEDELLEFRGIGRAQLPSNLLGVLSHIGEHAARHTGQVTTTAIIVRKK